MTSTSTDGRYVRIESPAQPDALIVRDLNDDVIYAFDPASGSLDEVGENLTAWGPLAPFVYNGKHLGSEDAAGRTGYAYFGVEPSTRLGEFDTEEIV